MNFHKNNNVIGFGAILLVSMVFQKCDYQRDGITESLGNGYHILVQGHSADILAKGDLELLSKINDYSYNDSFIVAIRNINQPFYDITPSDTVWQKKNGSDSIQYWIVNKIIDSLYGPFNGKEYQNMKRNLKVSNSLELNLQSPRFH
jgi:hypothetical protein